MLPHCLRAQSASGSHPSSEQHALISADEQQELAALPVTKGIAILVAALGSQEATIRRRAAGAICNASASEAALVALVDAGAAGALVRTLIIHPDPPTRMRSYPPPVPASLRALERLCVASAAAREDACEAVEPGQLLSWLAGFMSSGAEPSSRAAASRIVAALRRAVPIAWRGRGKICCVRSCCWRTRLAKDRTGLPRCM